MNRLKAVGILICLISSVFHWSLTNEAHADWVRTAYTYPDINYKTEGFMPNTDIYYIKEKYTTPATWYAYCRSYAQNYGDYVYATQFTVIIQGTFDETYEWQGGSPPIYGWSWDGAADHDLTSACEDTAEQVDEAYAIAEVDLDVYVPGTVSDSHDQDGEVYAQTKDGNIRVYNTYNGTDTGWSPGDACWAIGDTSRSYKVSMTSGSGPYHRKGIINELHARSFIRGDSTYAEAMVDCDFYLH